jgi:hypothetical protein
MAGATMARAGTQRQAPPGERLAGVTSGVYFLDRRCRIGRPFGGLAVELRRKSAGECRMPIRSLGFAFFILAGLLAGCSWFGGSSQNQNQQQVQLPPTEVPKHPEDPYHPRNPVNQDSGNLMSMLFGVGNNNTGSNATNANATTNANAASNGGGAPGGAGVGVNSYLWRATLDTVSFMPLASADPFGGVILTDWYSPNESQGERFKLNVLILGRELRADAVRCTVFRQKRDASGQWVDAPVDSKTGVDLENAILTRARQMRLATTAAK